jgi:predicted GNAT family acetyltransferase
MGLYGWGPTLYSRLALLAGHGAQDGSMSESVRNNGALNRFELDVDGHQAFAYYRLTPGVITFVHTEVPQALAGQGVGSNLIRGALEMVGAQGLKVVPQCPFVSAYMGKHPEYNDLLR